MVPITTIFKLGIRERVLELGLNYKRNLVTLISLLKYRQPSTCETIKEKNKKQTESLYS